MHACSLANASFDYGWQIAHEASAESLSTLSSMRSANALREVQGGDGSSCRQRTVCTWLAEASPQHKWGEQLTPRGNDSHRCEAVTVPLGLPDEARICSLTSVTAVSAAGDYAQQPHAISNALLNVSITAVSSGAPILYFYNAEVLHDSSDKLYTRGRTGCTHTCERLHIDLST